jgi:hypothetical protein
MKHLLDVVWALASAAFAIATIATALVQLIKDLSPIRRGFQRRFLATWFSQRWSARSKTVTHDQLIEAEGDLIRLATGGDRDAFYDLEPAQLCGQMNSAAQIALAYPNLHPALLRFLAPEARDGDMEIVTAGKGEDSDVSALLDARNRVTHQLQRSIDALQISMSFRWKFCLQVMIYIVCLALAFICLFAVKRGNYTVVEAIAVAIVAGFLSPVISDVAAAINRWRKP